MLSQSSNRVQAIKSKFENLSNESEQLSKPHHIPLNNKAHLYKHESVSNSDTQSRNNCENDFKEAKGTFSSETSCLLQAEKETNMDSDSSSDECQPQPNNSYLYSSLEPNTLKIESAKSSLSRQSSDPGKKLHRSHAFRCDKAMVINSPKRHNSHRSDTSEYSVQRDDSHKLSKDRLKKLTNVLTDRMMKENFVPSENLEHLNSTCQTVEFNSIPDDEVPKDILDQYAKVLKPKKKPESPVENRHDPMTDSGVSSETENLEEATEKNSRLKHIINKLKTASKTDFILKQTNESNVDIVLKNKTNLEVMKDDEICSSSETMKLERKNPHINLTETLKKALKQPLPNGPPPKKPPRSFVGSTETQDVKQPKDTKQMLEKLEQVLQRRENKPSSVKNIYDEAETNLSMNQKPNKEIHYLCTEILDIAHRTLLPNNRVISTKSLNCFNSLNCTAIPNQSTTSLPYTRLSMGSNCNYNPNNSSSLDRLDEIKDDRQRFSTFFGEKPSDSLCANCNNNLSKMDRFQCHLDCKCKVVSEISMSNQEHIYDEPHVDEASIKCASECDAAKVVFVVNKATPVERYSGGAHVKEHNMDRSGNGYGVPMTGSGGAQSKSLEDLRTRTDVQLDEKIYDIPCADSRPPTPEVPRTNSRLNFDDLLSSFEKGFQKHAEGTQTRRGTLLRKLEKGANPPPLVKTASDSDIKVSKSTESMAEELESVRKSLDRKFATESRRSRRFEKNGSQEDGRLSLSVPRKDRSDQLDVDRENLNRLMNEIYETVSAACRMDDLQRPSRFPTDQSDGTSSEDSVKLTRSLTEKRKNYVRRMSSRVAFLDSKNTRFRHQTSVCSYKSDVVGDNPYATFRSWKSFRNSQNNLSKSLTENKMADRHESDSKFNLTDSSGNVLSNRDELDDTSDELLADSVSLDDKAGCLDIELPFAPRVRGLFDVCLLVGLNHMTGQAYVKSVFPNRVPVPPHIENLVFPETLSSQEELTKAEYELEASRTQCYSLVLTNEKGERNFGYCRRVLPEGATCCLPLCYCIIGRHRAPGFYYKVLQEIESHHGSSDVEIYTILQQFLDTDFPNPGESIQINCTKRQELDENASRSSLNLGDVHKSKTMPDKRREGGVDSSGIPEFYDIENNNSPKKMVLVVQGPKCKVLKRPIEPRIDEDNLSTLLDSLGPSLLIKVFGSLLLERKVVFISDNLSQLSSCMEALQAVLYPFVWQQPLISTIPSELKRDILEAPLPILAGMLRREGVDSDSWESDLEGLLFEEGMLMDLSNGTTKILFYQGDESTILPSVSSKTLKTTLQMESSRSAGKEGEVDGTRNVMISEAFLRFFVDVLWGFWDYFSVGALAEGALGKGDVVFHKENFVKSAPTKHIQYFLDWFTETAMFSHFVQNMAVCYRTRQQMATPVDYSSIDGVVDAPLPNFYELFDERVTGKLSSCKKWRPDQKCEPSAKTNYKSGLNKKVKMLKMKLKDLVS